MQALRQRLWLNRASKRLKKAWEEYRAAAPHASSAADGTRAGDGAAAAAESPCGGDDGTSSAELQHGHKGGGNGGGAQALRREKLAELLDSLLMVRESEEFSASGLHRIFDDTPALFADLLEELERGRGDERFCLLCLRGAEIIARDPASRELVCALPHVVSRVLALLETVTPLPGKALVLHIIKHLAVNTDVQMAIGRQEGFKKIFLLLVLRDPDLTREVLATLKLFLDIHRADKAQASEADDTAESVSVSGDAPGGTRGPRAGGQGGGAADPAAARGTIPGHQPTNADPDEIGVLAAGARQLFSVVGAVGDLVKMAPWLRGWMGEDEERAGESDGPVHGAPVQSPRALGPSSSRTAGGEYDSDGDAVRADGGMRRRKSRDAGTLPSARPGGLSLEEFVPGQAAMELRRTRLLHHAREVDGAKLSVSRRRHSSGASTAARATPSGSLGSGEEDLETDADPTTEERDSVFQEFMRMQGALKALISTLWDAKERDELVDVLSTIRMLLLRNVEAQLEFAVGDGFHLLQQLLEQGADDGSERAAVCMEDICNILFTIIVDGSPARLAGNMDALRFLLYLVCASSRLAVCRRSVRVLLDLLAANPLNVMSFVHVDAFSTLLSVLAAPLLPSRPADDEGGAPLRGSTAADDDRESGHARDTTAHLCSDGPASAGAGHASTNARRVQHPLFESAPGEWLVLCRDVLVLWRYASVLLQKRDAAPVVALVSLSEALGSASTSDAVDPVELLDLRRVPDSSTLSDAPGAGRLDLGILSTASSLALTQLRWQLLESAVALLDDMQARGNHVRSPLASVRSESLGLVPLSLRLLVGQLAAVAEMSQVRKSPLQPRAMRRTTPSAPVGANVSAYSTDFDPGAAAPTLVTSTSLPTSESPSHDSKSDYRGGETDTTEGLREGNVLGDPLARTSVMIHVTIRLLVRVVLFSESRPRVRGASAEPGFAEGSMSAMSEYDRENGWQKLSMVVLAPESSGVPLDVRQVALWSLREIAMMCARGRQRDDEVPHGSAAVSWLVDLLRKDIQSPETFAAESRTSEPSKLSLPPPSRSSGAAKGALHGRDAADQREESDEDRSGAPTSRSLAGSARLGASDASIKPQRPGPPAPLSLLSSISTIPSSATQSDGSPSRAKMRSLGDPPQYVSLLVLQTLISMVIPADEGHATGEDAALHAPDDASVPAALAGGSGGQPQGDAAFFVWQPERPAEAAHSMGRPSEEDGVQSDAHLQAVSAAMTARSADRELPVASAASGTLLEDLKNECRTAGVFDLLLSAIRKAGAAFRHAEQCERKAEVAQDALQAHEAKHMAARTMGTAVSGPTGKAAWSEPEPDDHATASSVEVHQLAADGVRTEADANAAWEEAELAAAEAEWAFRLLGELVTGCPANKLHVGREFGYLTLSNLIRDSTLVLDEYLFDVLLELSVQPQIRGTVLEGAPQLAFVKGRIVLLDAQTRQELRLRRANSFSRSRSHSSGDMSDMDGADLGGLGAALGEMAGGLHQALGADGLPVQMSDLERALSVPLLCPGLLPLLTAVLFPRPLFPRPLVCLKSAETDTTVLAPAGAKGGGPLSTSAVATATVAHAGNSVSGSGGAGSVPVPGMGGRSNSSRSLGSSGAATPAGGNAVVTPIGTLSRSLSGHTSTSAERAAPVGETFARGERNASWTSLVSGRSSPASPKRSVSSGGHVSAGSDAESPDFDADYGGEGTGGGSSSESASGTGTTLGKVQLVTQVFHRSVSGYVVASEKRGHGVTESARSRDGRTGLRLKGASSTPMGSHAPVSREFRNTEAALMAVLLVPLAEADVQAQALSALAQLLAATMSNVRALVDMQVPSFLIRLGPRLTPEIQEAYLSIATTLLTYDVGPRDLGLLMSLTRLPDAAQFRPGYSDTIAAPSSSVVAVEVENASDDEDDRFGAMRAAGPSVALRARLLDVLDDIVARGEPSSYYSLDGTDSWLRLPIVEKFPPVKVGYSQSMWLRVTAMPHPETTLFAFIIEGGQPCHEVFYRRVNAAPVIPGLSREAHEAWSAVGRQSSLSLGDGSGELAPHPTGAPASSVPHGGVRRGMPGDPRRGQHNAGASSSVSSAVGGAVDESADLDESEQFYLCLRSVTSAPGFPAETFVFDQHRWSVDGLWHNVTLTHSRDALTLFVDGEEVQSLNRPLGYPTLVSREKRLGGWIGRPVDSSVGASAGAGAIRARFSGLIGTVTVCEGVWEAADVRRAYKSGASTAFVAGKELIKLDPAVSTRKRSESSRWRRGSINVGWNSQPSPAVYQRRSLGTTGLSAVASALGNVDELGTLSAASGAGQGMAPHTSPRLAPRRARTLSMGSHMPVSRTPLTVRSGGVLTNIAVSPMFTPSGQSPQSGLDGSGASAGVDATGSALRSPPRVKRRASSGDARIGPSSLELAEEFDSPPLPARGTAESSSIAKSAAGAQPGGEGEKRASVAASGGAVISVESAPGGDIAMDASTGSSGEHVVVAGSSAVHHTRWAADTLESIGGISLVFPLLALNPMLHVSVLRVLGGLLKQQTLADAFDEAQGWTIARHLLVQMRERWTFRTFDAILDLAAAGERDTASGAVPLADMASAGPVRKYRLFQRLGALELLADLLFTFDSGTAATTAALRDRQLVDKVTKAVAELVAVHGVNTEAWRAGPGVGTVVDLLGRTAPSGRVPASGRVAQARRTSTAPLLSLIETLMGVGRPQRSSARRSGTTQRGSGVRAAQRSSAGSGRRARGVDKAQDAAPAELSAATREALVTDMALVIDRVVASAHDSEISTELLTVLLKLFSSEGGDITTGIFQACPEGNWRVPLALLSSPDEGLRIQAFKLLGLLLHASGAKGRLQFVKHGGMVAARDRLAAWPASHATCQAVYGLLVERWRMRSRSRKTTSSKSRGTRGKRRSSSRSIERESTLSRRMAPAHASPARGESEEVSDSSTHLIKAAVASSTSRRSRSARRRWTRARARARSRSSTDGLESGDGSASDVRGTGGSSGSDHDSDRGAAGDDTRFVNPAALEVLLATLARSDDMGVTMRVFADLDHAMNPRTCLAAAQNMDAVMSCRGWLRWFFDFLQLREQAVAHRELAAQKSARSYAEVRDADVASQSDSDASPGRSHSGSSVGHRRGHSGGSFAAHLVAERARSGSGAAGAGGAPSSGGESAPSPSARRAKARGLEAWSWVEPVNTLVRRLMLHDMTQSTRTARPCLEVLKMIDAGGFQLTVIANVLEGLIENPELQPDTATNTLRNLAMLLNTAATKLAVPPELCAEAVNVINVLAARNPPEVRSRLKDTGVLEARDSLVLLCLRGCSATIDAHAEALARMEAVFETISTSTRFREAGGVPRLLMLFMVAGDSRALELQLKFGAILGNLVERSEDCRRRIIRIVADRVVMAQLLGAVQLRLDDASGSGWFSWRGFGAPSSDVVKLDPSAADADDGDATSLDDTGGATDTASPTGEAHGSAQRVASTSPEAAGAVAAPSAAADDARAASPAATGLTVPEGEQVRTVREFVRWFNAPSRVRAEQRGNLWTSILRALEPIQRHEERAVEKAARHRAKALRLRLEKLNKQVVHRQKQVAAISEACAQMEERCRDRDSRRAKGRQAARQARALAGRGAWQQLEIRGRGWDFLQQAGVECGAAAVAALRRDGNELAEGAALPFVGDAGAVDGGDAGAGAGAASEPQGAAAGGTRADVPCPECGTVIEDAWERVCHVALDHVDAVAGGGGAVGSSRASGRRSTTATTASGASLLSPPPSTPPTPDITMGRTASPVADSVDASAAAGESSRD